MDRRSFLGALGALPASAARRRVGVYAHLWLYASRQPGYNAAPIIADIFRDLSGAGLDGIELMHQVLLDDAAFARLPELARRYRLPVVGSSWEAPLWRREAHPEALATGRRIIERVASVKGRLLGLSVGDARRRKTDAELDAQAEMVRTLMRIGSDHGVTVNLHNHVYEVRDGEHDLNGTLARVPEAKLGPDIGWLVRAKVDPLDFIRRHDKRIVYFHLRNEKADGTWPEDLTEGVIDFAAIGRLLHELRYAGDVAIELAHEAKYQPQRSNGENFRISRQYVRQVLRY